jgi:hypothetical protein
MRGMLLANTRSSTRQAGVLCGGTTRLLPIGLLYDRSAIVQLVQGQALGATRATARCCPKGPQCSLQGTIPGDVFSS